MHLWPRAVNRECPVTAICRIHSLYPAFVNTHCSYINNSWSQKEFKDELKKEINSEHMCKVRDYVTSPRCTSAPPSDSVGSHYAMSPRNYYKTPGFANL